MTKNETNLTYYFELFKKGDQKAFEFIFKHYYPKLIKYATINMGIQTLGQLDDAEDIVIEIFAKVWDRKQRFETIVHLKNSLYVSVNNQCINLMRTEKRKRDTFKYAPLLDDHTDIINLLEKEKDLEAIILAKLHVFTKQQQEILLLGMEGKQGNEIAKELNCTPNVVYVHRSRIKKTLQKILQPYF